MRHLPLTIAFLLASAPVWAQGAGSSIEKSFSSMQDSAERVQSEVSPPASEAMQEKAEKFVRDLAGKDAAMGDSSPARSEAESRPEQKSSGPASSQASSPAGSPEGASGMSGNGGMYANKGAAASPPPKASMEVGTGALSDMVEKNTLDSTPPGGKVEPDPQGDTILPRNRKSKSAGLRTGDSKKGRQEQGETSQTAAVKPVRKIPGFVELN